jgi:hypothetical protein
MGIHLDTRMFHESDMVSIPWSYPVLQTDRANPPIDSSMYVWRASWANVRSADLEIYLSAMLAEPKDQGCGQHRFAEFSW